MKKGDVIFFFVVACMACMIFVLFACKTQYIPVGGSTDSVYIEKMIPVVNPADSASIRALFECDENGRVVLKWLDIANSKNVEANLKLDSLGNVLARMKVPPDTIYLPSKEIKVEKKVPYPVEVNVEVNRLTSFQSFQIWCGRILFLLLVGFLITRYIRKKYLP